MMQLVPFLVAGSLAIPAFQQSHELPHQQPQEPAADDHSTSEQRSDVEVPASQSGRREVEVEPERQVETEVEDLNEKEWNQLRELFELEATSARYSAPLVTGIEVPGEGPWGEAWGQSEHFKQSFQGKDTRSLTLYDVVDLTGFNKLEKVEQQLAQNVEDHREQLKVLERLIELETEIEQSVQALAKGVLHFCDPPFVALGQVESASGLEIETPKQQAALVRALTGRAVLVNGTQEQHEWVRNFFELQRVFAKRHIMLSTRMVAIPEEVAEAFGTGGEFPKIVPTAEAEDFLNQLQASGECTLLQAPKISMLPRQRAMVTTGEQRAYVGDFKVVSLGNGNVVADPIVMTLFHGMTLEGVCYSLPNDFMGLTVDLSHSELKEPIAEFETSLGANMSPVTIQLPEITKVRARAELRLQATETAILKVNDSHSGEVHFVFFELS